jgi:hypothetical protein
MYDDDGVDFKYLYFELNEKAVEPYNILLQAG